MTAIDTTEAPNLHPDIVESLVLDGDLSRLNAQQRVAYYVHRCAVLGIDPGEQPFDLINLNGKLKLYATKTCANALTRVNRLSIEIKSTKIEGTLVIIEARAVDPSGRFADDMGVLDLEDRDNKRLGKANAIMKAATKAKRRAVLALVGLGVLDVSEVDDIGGVRRVRLDVASGEIEAEPPPPSGTVDTVAVQRPDVGPRCTGKGQALGEAVDADVEQLAARHEITKAKAFAGAIKRAGVDLEAYGDAPPRTPFELTIADGKRVHDWARGVLDDSSDAEGQPETAAAGPSAKARVMKRLGSLTLDDLAPIIGAQHWPRDATEADWTRAAEALEDGWTLRDAERARHGLDEVDDQ